MHLSSNFLILNKKLALCILQQIRFVDEFFNKLFFSCNRIDWNSATIVFAYKCVLYLIYSFAQKSKAWLNGIKPFIKFNILSLFQKKITYIFYNVECSYYYVGSTKRTLYARTQDHIRNSKSKTHFKRHKVKFYKFLIRLGTNKWAVAILNDTATDFRDMEKAFIKLLFPKLNTKHMKSYRNNFIFTKHMNLRSYIQLKQILAHNNKPYISFEMFVYKNDIFCKLIQMLRFSHFQNIDFQKTPGNFSCTNWKRLQNSFQLIGFVIFKHHIWKFQNTKALKTFFDILTNETFRVQISSIIKILNLAPKKIMYKLVNARKKLNNHVDDLSDFEIWQCFKYTNSFKTFSRYNFICKYRFRYILKRRFGFFFLKNIIIKVPFTPSYSKGEIANVFMEHVSTCKNNMLFLNLIKNKTKVVFKKRDNIAVMLHNHIAFSKNISSLTCDCSCYKCDENRISMYTPIGTPINNNFVIKVDNFNERKDICFAINSILRKIHIYKPIKVNQITSIKTTIHSKSKFHTYIHNQIQQIKSENNNRILAPLDKNTGALISFCPSNYLKATLKLFNWTNDNAYYELCELNEDQILKLWKKLFQQNKTASDLGNFNHNGRVPYAYAIPKDKDTKRFRPVVSYFKHPLKMIYNRAARALLFLLDYADIGNMLKKCDDLIEKISLFTFHNHYKLYLTTFDIKDMYTNLEHHLVIKNALWLLDFVNQKSRRKIICINKFGKKGVKWGRSFNPHKSTHIKFIDLINIIKLDIKNCYMKIGHFMLRQIIGIPMGSPLSAILAILCCCIAEYNWQLSLRHSNIFARIFLTRYVDDGLIIIKQLINNKNERDKIVNDLFTKYPDKLRLLIEQQGDKVHFLENCLQVKNSSISISHYNKNTEHLKSGFLKKLNIIDYNTFAPFSQKIATVIGTLIRVQRMSNDTINAIIDVFNVIVEFLYLNFPCKVIRKAVLHIFDKHKHPLWALIYLGLIKNLK